MQYVSLLGNASMKAASYSYAARSLFSRSLFIVDISIAWSAAVAVAAAAAMHVFSSLVVAQRSPALLTMGPPVGVRGNPLHTQPWMGLALPLS